MTSAMHDGRGTTAVTTRVTTGASGKMKAAGAIGACRAVIGRPVTCINGRMRNSAGTVVVMPNMVSNPDHGPQQESRT
jgi:protein subunit release factor A